MPNHIKNKIELIGSIEEIDSMIKQFSKEYPATVKREGFLSFPEFEKVIPPPDDPAYRDLPSQDIARDSPNWWHTWNIKNWGTKWGGYENERISHNIFSFETAWSSAPKIIDRISRAYPGVTIKYTWADEDTGQNCGRAIYLNGLVASDIPKGGSKEAYDIAFELRPDYAKDYVLTDGKYKYALKITF